jgi:hypothetical protein
MVLVQHMRHQLLLKVLNLMGTLKGWASVQEPDRLV